MDHALRVLEFSAVLERLERHCETPLAAAAALELQPSFDPKTVELLLAQTEQAKDFISRYSVPSLGSVKDWRTTLDRMAKGGSGTGLEIVSIGDAMSAMRNAKAMLANHREAYGHLWPLVEFVPEHPRLEENIQSSIEPSGDVKDSASEALSRLRIKKRQTSSRVLEVVQAYTTGSRRDLLSDPIYTVRDGRYVIPLKAENRGKIKGIVHDTSGSGQTIYLEPEDVLQLGNQLKEIEAAEQEEVRRILAALAAKIGAVAGELIAGIESVSSLDAILARARFAFDLRGNSPLPADRHSIVIRQGRHPLLEAERVVPLDMALGSKNGNVLITGPNTGGKTVAIKTVGLFVAMLQCGLFVPALEVRFSPFTQIWADIGDEQSLQQSLSTFSAHIKNIGEALKSITPGALVLLDEIGAGTDPAEGAALARAILSELAERGATILASTHYGELKAFAYSDDRFINAAMEFDSKSLRPTYRLMVGVPGASHALKIAERYGIPAKVVESAKVGLGEQHLDVAQMLERLEQSQRQARIAQGEADRRTAELRKREEEAAKKLEQAESIRSRANERAHDLIDEALRQIRLEASDIFDELKRAGGNQSAIEQARARLKDLQEVGKDLAEEFVKKPAKPQAQPAKGKVQWRQGDSVKLGGYAQTGVLLNAPDQKKALVQLGPLKMTVDWGQLTKAETTAKEKPRSNISLQRAQTATTELNLRAKRAEDAMEELDKFLDEAVLAGLPNVRIVHGKGEGILRQLTRQALQRHRHVKSYREGEPGEGGAGVTIATFK